MPMILFLLTRPLRDVTASLFLWISWHQFLLTRPLRDVTDSPNTSHTQKPISTHTPLAGRDLIIHSGRRLFYISTHTPLAGRD